MDSIVIIFILALSALLFIYLYYDRFKKEKKGKDLTSYIEGLKALLDGRDDEAFGKFREAVAEDSENIDAYVRIGNILRKYGKTDKALQVHKDLTIRHGLSPDAKRLILRALSEDFLALNDNASALSALRELISIGGDDRWAAERLLELYSRTGDWEAAFEMKERLVKSDGAKSKGALAVYKFLQGEKVYNEKEYHKARLLFKEAINLDAACIPAYIFIGDSYLAENREEDAVEFWKRLIKTVPEASHFVLGRLKRALFDLGKFGDIYTICNEILETSPKNLDARLTLAEYHFKKGEYSDAMDHLSVAIEDHPESYMPVLDLAKISLTVGDKKRLSDLINRLEQRREAVENEYHCTRCGFKSRTKKWQCPSCKAVDSFVI